MTSFFENFNFLLAILPALIATKAGGKTAKPAQKHLFTVANLERGSTLQVFVQEILIEQLFILHTIQISRRILIRVYGSYKALILLKRLIITDAEGDDTPPEASETTYSSKHCV